MKKLVIITFLLLAASIDKCAKKENIVNAKTGVSQVSTEDAFVHEEHMAQLCTNIYKSSKKNKKILFSELMQNPIAISITAAQINVLKDQDGLYAQKLVNMCPVTGQEDTYVRPDVNGCIVTSEDVPCDVIDPKTGEPSETNWIMHMHDAVCVATLCNKIKQAEDKDIKIKLLKKLMYNPIGLAILGTQIDVLRFQDIALTAKLFEFFPKKYMVKYAFTAARIGAVYQSNGRLGDALKFNTMSHNAAPMGAVMRNMSILREMQEDLNVQANNMIYHKPAAYWLQKAQKSGFIFDSQDKCKLIYYYQSISKLPDQHNDFEYDLELILQNDDQDLYNPMILTTRDKLKVVHAELCTAKINS